MLETLFEIGIALSVSLATLFFIQCVARTFR
jgi:hypothetical protein